ncbi:The BTB (BR-C, ttk and bab)/POZ (Pox virus and Zinc finger) domain [Ceratobasidium sp. AG-Ba]|nr:The BTB (BR-C, ttk and bab)/POZ (Pox virus and Zinc finger) domain [Ceratobasidium sp. AG-Ba]
MDTIETITKAPALGLRDGNYYFEDGSIVIRVEHILFKIHRSLLASHSELFEGMFQIPVPQDSKESDSPGEVDGATDKSPVVIPDIKAAQFRNLLLYIYGTTSNTEYRALVQDTIDESACTPTLFRRYLDIASLAQRFCMAVIESWALKQLKKLLRFSKKLSGLPWSNSDIFDSLAYSSLTFDQEFQHDLHNLICCSVYNCYLPCLDPSRKRSGRSLSTRLGQLYNHPTLKQQDPALFGFVFCMVLSAGYQSSIWQGMTRDERAKLYAAQTQLTPLPSTLPIGWVQNPSELSSSIPNESRPSCFSSCSQNFVQKVNQIIKRGEFVEELPLRGITAMCKLPTYRQQLAESPKPSNECVCTLKMLEKIDLKLDALFTELAEIHYNCLD